MSQTDVPTVGADDPNHHPGGDNAVGGQRESGSTFWGSMPRILTALGGLVTALGTAAAVYFGGIAGDDSSSPTPQPPSPPSQVIILDGRAAPAPAVEGAGVGRSSRTSGVLSGRETTPSGTDEIVATWESTLDAGTAAVAEGCADGYTGDCEDLLEILVDDCEYGDAPSCDVLFLISPVGSALEDYGDSCGGRVRDNDEWCSDLVGD